MKYQRGRRMAAVAGAMLSIVGASACGSSTSSPSSSTSASSANSTDPSSSNPTVSVAQAAVAGDSKVPAPISLPAVGKAIPKNVNLTLLSVATPSIQPLNSGVIDGAKALGWTTKVISPPTTPEAYASALDSIVQEKPSALIFFTPFPLSSFQEQLSKLKAEGVPIITAGASTYPVGGSSPVIADTSGANIFGPLAKLMAQVVVASSGGKPDAAWVVDPSVPAWQVMTKDFKQEIEAAGGTFNEIDVPEADIGKNSPDLIVSYLQAHPGIKYVSLVVGAYDLGLQQALQSAGLSGKVQLGDTDATPQDVAAIKDGQLSATVAIETTSDGYRLVDLMARTQAHAPLPYVHVPSELLVVKKSNVALGNNITAFPDDTSAFLKAWGVS